MMILRHRFLVTRNTVIEKNLNEAIAVIRVLGFDCEWISESPFCLREKSNLDVEISATAATSVEHTLRRTPDSSRWDCSR